MLLVVFGAGASYDSSPDYSPESDYAHPTQNRFRPPLANQLFELRQSFAAAAEKIPKCQLILNQLRNRPSDVSVEQQLETLREQALSYPEAQRQLVSVQFYLQWIIGDCQLEWNRNINSHTTYRALLGQIDRQLKGKPACLTSFNYDTLLEEAFTSLSSERRFESLAEYILRNDYKIIKPHGSVNWVRELTSSMPVAQVDPVQIANRTIETADGLKASDNYYVIPEQERRRWGSVLSYTSIPGKTGLQAVLPAVAIPLEKKHDYVCPVSHIDALKECVSKTDKLLVIGWKGAEENFVDLLSKGLKRGIPKMVVSSSKDSAEKVMGTLLRSGIDGENWRSGESGFSGEVQSGNIEGFIAK